LNHGGGTVATIRATSGSGAAGGDKHYYEDAKSEHERAFKKHCIFSLNVSTIGTKVSSLEERSHQNSHPKITSAAGYNFLVVGSLWFRECSPSTGDQEAQP
jgi:hypothetical protein